MPSDGLRAVNVYAIDDGDGDGVTMIDGGWALPEARTALEKALDQLGHGPASIKKILVTHVHRDHYTLAVLLRREFGTPVSLGAGERTSLAVLTGNPAELPTQLDLLRTAGAPELAELMSPGDPQPGRAPHMYEEPDEWLDAGAVRLPGRTLRVLPTPGHTQGHVVFADEAAGVLFAGDHVLPHITPSIGMEPVAADGPLSDYLDSLALIRTLPDLTLLPAHGPVAPSTHARVGELVAHHDARLAETTDAVAGLGSATGAEVAAALGWTRRRRPFSSLDPFNQMLAVTETVAHLRLLVRTGTLEADGGDTVIYRLLQRG
jgi:glyoxylase-like metal-dependent hydrolase (beta-lactamase superfamily II)